MTKILKATILLLLAIFVAPIALAQGTTASISGTVMDETGGVIPGVSITVTNVDTGISRPTVSNDAGRYLAAELELGNYEVKGELTGFQTSVRSGILLTVGRAAVVDLTMTVGSITEVVTVAGEAALVDTRGSSMSELVAGQQIEDLPVNGRNVLRLALLAGGVLERIGQTATSNSLIGGFGTQLTMAGGRAHHNAFLLDGARVNNYNNYGPGSLARTMLGQDSIREFKVLSSNFSAEHGNAAGGIVTWVTKSGSNQFHGSLFHSHRNDNLDAANFITNSRGRTKDPFIRNQFGVSIGGPIVPNRTFFFFNYEGIRERLGLTGIANTITAEARQGVLPVRADGSCPTGFPFDETSGNCVGTVAPSVVPYLDLFPQPNGREIGDGRAEHVLDASEPTNEDYFVGKVDHSFNENHSLYVRFLNDTANKTSGFNTVSQSLLETANNYWTIEEKSIFSPKFLNVIRYSYVRNRVEDLEDLQRDIDPSLYFLPHTGKLGSMWIGPGSGGLGSYLVSPTPSDGRPRNEVQNLFQFNNNSTYTTGRHTIKFGIENRRVQNNLVFVVRWGGRYRFTDLVAFLRGLPREVTGTTPASDFQRGWRQTLWGFYIQDDFQIRPNLTLNLGLRYSPHSVPTEEHDKLSNLRDPFNDADFTLGSPLFENPSLANWAPRLGFAWDPTGGGKTSIRGGAGIFYHLLDIGQSFLQGTISQPPVDRFLLNTRNSPGGIVPFPNPGTGPFPAGARGAFPKPFNNIDTPKMIKWNLDVQRELSPGTVASLGYVGSHGLYLWADRFVNVCASETFEERRFFRAGCNSQRNPNFATIQMRDNPSSSKYHALIFKLNRRFSDGFGLQTSFTWSKSIDDESGLRGSTGRGSILIWGGTLDDIQAIRGPSDFDVRRNLVVSASWALPGPQGGAAGTLLGGWQMNGILTLADGWPFSALISSVWVPDGSPVFGGYMADLIPGNDHNSVNVGNPDNYIDKSAFRIPATSEDGTLNAPGCGTSAADRCRAMGNLGRNTVRAPGVATFDFSLFKKWSLSALGEQGNVEFRAEFFNLANRANFMRPISTTIFNSRGSLVPGSGSIIMTTTTARQIQFGLRVGF